MSNESEEPPAWGAPPPSSGQPPTWSSPPPGQQQAWGSQPPPSSGSQPGQPAWHQLPPDQLARLHQPGIIPLRPLTVGDIFGGALQTMRRNPGATIGTAFLVLALLLVPSYLVSLAVLQVDTIAIEDRGILVTLVGALFSVLASVALTGMIVHVVGEAVLGDRASLGETWRAVRGRIPALLATLLLIALLLTALTVVAVIATLLLGWAASGVSEVLIVVVIVLAALAMFVGLVWASIRLSLAPAAVVLEGVGPWRGLRRAWSLTTGGQGWRVVGISILASILVGIFTSAVQVPLTALATTLGTDLDPLSDESLFSPLLIGIDHVVQLLVNAFAVPFSAGVTALLYLDQRIRREGLETALLQAAQERAAARGT